jgi:hypothetical protein
LTRTSSPLIGDAMRRRRLLLCLGIVVCMGLATGVFVWLTFPSDELTQEKCESIKLGMTMDEAAAILGLEGRPEPWVIVSSPPTTTYYRLEFPDGVVMMLTDENDRVYACKFHPKLPPSFWDRLRSLLPW